MEVLDISMDDTFTKLTICYVLHGVDLEIKCHFIINVFFIISDSRSGTDKQYLVLYPKKVKTT